MSGRNNEPLATIVIGCYEDCHEYICKILSHVPTLSLCVRRMKYEAGEKREERRGGAKNRVRKKEEASALLTEETSLLA